MFLGTVFFVQLLASPYRQRNELRRLLAESGDLDEVNQVITELKSRPVKLSDNTSVSFAEILVALREELAWGLNTRDLNSMLWENRGVELGNVEPHQFLAALSLQNIISTNRVDPAPGSPSSVRKSLHDLPYTMASLTDFGKQVVFRLWKSGDT